jgi:hypothetical protein
MTAGYAVDGLFLCIMLLMVVSGAASFIALVAALLPRPRQRLAGFYYITALSVLPPVMMAAMCIRNGGNVDSSSWLIVCLPLFMSVAALCVHYIKNE